MLIFQLHLPHVIPNSMQALHALSHSEIIIYAIVDLEAQWLKREAEVVEPLMMSKVQILNWSHFFFLFAHLFISPFHNSLFFYLHRFLVTTFLKLFATFLNIYCSVHTGNLLFSDIGINIGIGKF